VTLRLAIAVSIFGIVYVQHDIDDVVLNAVLFNDFPMLDPQTLAAQQRVKHTDRRGAAAISDLVHDVGLRRLLQRDRGGAARRARPPIAESSRHVSRARPKEAAAAPTLTPPRRLSLRAPAGVPRRRRQRMEGHSHVRLLAIAAASSLRAGRQSHDRPTPKHGVLRTPILRRRTPNRPFANVDGRPVGRDGLVDHATKLMPARRMGRHRWRGAGGFATTSVRESSPVMIWAAIVVSWVLLFRAWARIRLKAVSMSM
jgi:hypothetical protein